MLRAPFVRLFGPLFGSHKDSNGNIKRQSYALGWRSNHHPGVGHMNTIFHTNVTQGDSDGNIIDDALPESRPGALNHVGKDIFITNEFSIERNELQKQRTETMSCDDTNTARSVSEDKPEEKSPYYHV